MQNFFDFILIFTEESVMENDNLEPGRYCKQFKDIVQILGVDVFKTKEMYHTKLSKLREKIGSIINREIKVYKVTTN